MAIDRQNEKMTRRPKLELVWKAPEPVADNAGGNELARAMAAKIARDVRVAQIRKR